MKEMKLDGKLVYLWHPIGDMDRKKSPLLLVPSGDTAPKLLSEICPAIEKRVAEGKCDPFWMTTFVSKDWNREYSPWKASPLFKKEPPFGGEGAKTLEWIQSALIPEVSSYTGGSYTRENTSILGYSLAGLFSLWAFYESNLFGGVGSCSGSLWYDGWIEYIEKQQAVGNSKVYLSLGDREEKTRSQRMASVGNTTRYTLELLEKDPNVLKTTLKWHEGGHFTEETKRMVEGICWLFHEGN